MPFLIREQLRRDTAAEHERLDAALGTFDLSDRAGYIAFLRVHARALPPIEAALAGRAPWPAWRPRASRLIADLAALDEPLPAPLPVDPPAEEAAAWGMLYVLEGSRLGGAMLAERVGPGLPRSYLSARHQPGEWRGFLAAMETACGPRDYPQALSGAHTAFHLFATAARDTQLA